MDVPIASEEQAAARVERSARAAEERVDAERKRIEEERDSRCRMLSALVDKAIARILADAERDVMLRRAHREGWLEQHAGRPDARPDAAAESLVAIIRDRPRKKTL